MNEIPMNEMFLDEIFPLSHYIGYRLHDENKKKLIRNTRCRFELGAPYMLLPKNNQIAVPFN